MTRRHLLLALFDRSPRNTEDFYTRLADFDGTYQQFVNRLCDWPRAEKCRPDLGVLDLRLFRKAGEAARRLWQ